MMKVVLVVITVIITGTSVTPILQKGTLRLREVNSPSWVTQLVLGRAGT